MTKRICRVSGVAFHNERVLLHKSEEDDFWVLPGGGCMEHETTIQAARREFREEIGAEIEIHKLLWVVENLFEYKDEKHHSIEFYYLISFPQTDIYQTDVFHGYEEELDLKLTFKWHKIDEIDHLSIYPTCLKKLIKSRSDGIQHVIHKAYETVE